MIKAPNPIDKHVGARLRMRRLMVGMSQGKLGEALGRDVPADPEIREGHQPDRRQPAAAARAGAGSAARLFLRRRPVVRSRQADVRGTGGSSYVVDFLSTSEGLQLNRAFALIRDPKVRKKILDLVVSLSREGIAPLGRSFYKTNEISSIA